MSKLHITLLFLGINSSFRLLFFFLPYDSLFKVRVIVAAKRYPNYYYYCSPNPKLYITTGSINLSWDLNAIPYTKVAIMRQYESDLVSNHPPACPSITHGRYLAVCYLCFFPRSLKRLLTRRRPTNWRIFIKKMSRFEFRTWD